MLPLEWAGAHIVLLWIREVWTTASVPRRGARLDGEKQLGGGIVTQPLIVHNRVRFGEQIDVRLPLSGGLVGKTLRGLVYKPRCYSSESPVVVVMHGVTRAADSYMASWLPAAERYGFLLIVPEFTRKHWPKARTYNLGNMLKGGALLPKADWTFSILNNLVDAILEETGSRATRFGLYGHSAGAQFVHRYVMFTGGQRLTHAVAANSGWYTLPCDETAFPYGISNTPHVHETLEQGYRTPLTILLGREDTDVGDPNLRRTAEAMAQGPHRLARGRYFFARSREHAAKNGFAFNWSLVEREGVGHNDRDMADAAFNLICPLSRAPVDATTPVRHCT